MEHAVTKGIYDGMSAILILLAVGALVGTWISGGIVPSLIYYGLKVIQDVYKRQDFSRAYPFTGRSGYWKKDCII